MRIRGWLARRLVAVVCICALPSVVPAADICSNTAGQGDQAVREQYQTTIDWYLNLASAAKLKGFDPSRFPQSDFSGNVISVNFLELIEALTQKRDQAISAIYAAYQDCERNIQPYQNIVDTTTYFLTGGIYSVIPERATHIDASRLLSGTPFGGPGAVVPQVREQMFGLLGIGGGAANLIRNPLQVSPSGLIRGAWNPILGAGLPFQIPHVPSLPGNISLPTIPPVSNPPSIPLGSVGGHRVCIPWC